jgi:DNA gyrase/topoisomerase IV subunit A
MTDRDADLTADDELRSVREQLHVYDAIVVAANDAHAALDVVLDASDPDAARHALELRYGFTETQAWAVLEVQFRRMTALDRQKIEDRRDELVSRAAALEEELGHPDPSTSAG